MEGVLSSILPTLPTLPLKGIVGKVWQSQYRLKLFFSLYIINNTYSTYFTIDGKVGIGSKVCSIAR